MRWAWIALTALAPIACEVQTAPRGPEQLCVQACRERATGHAACTPHRCWRGCNLVLDRLVEREGDHVIACIARGGRGCDDAAWAYCATRVGPYADGGPPAPPPPVDDSDEAP